MGSKIKTYRPFVVALAAISMMALSATAALAQYPTAEDFGVSCTAAAPGASAQCSVVGAAAAEVLSASASADGDTFYSDSIMADEDGRATFGFTVPSEVRGEVLVRVSGPTSGEATTTVAVTDAADEGEAVEAAPTEQRLPLTGGQIGMLLALAVGLLVVGGAATRKKDRQRVDA
jgi:hypothetical protein